MFLHAAHTLVSTICTAACDRFMTKRRPAKIGCGRISLSGVREGGMAEWCKSPLAFAELNPPPRPTKPCYPPLPGVGKLVATPAAKVRNTGRCLFISQTLSPKLQAFLAYTFSAAGACLPRRLEDGPVSPSSRPPPASPSSYRPLSLPVDCASAASSFLTDLVVPEKEEKRAGLKL
ncbi:hypothetical protein PRIPAC_77631 [Pristionchus pacificus]|uniref:Uncharacterized protein n=1 Tax=Pristionchus pacificus TaxID=54126 RepID=A0A2A6BX20_PRIPA|nr:hypothetical protein PRIPAC_77631 [Pristionchus pacificus]|eukprot:PDM70311.1 hypothetical protein PRIPAC_46557 [Pristionchus pacificus]